MKLSSLAHSSSSSFLCRAQQGSIAPSMAANSLYQGLDPDNGIRAVLLGGPVPAPSSATPRSDRSTVITGVDLVFSLQLRAIHSREDLDLDGDPRCLQPPDPPWPDPDLDLDLDLHHNLRFSGKMKAAAVPVSASAVPLPILPFVFKTSLSTTFIAYTDGDGNGNASSRSLQRSAVNSSQSSTSNGSCDRCSSLSRLPSGPPTPPVIGEPMTLDDIELPSSRARLLFGIDEIYLRSLLRPWRDDDDGLLTIVNFIPLRQLHSTIDLDPPWWEVQLKKLTLQWRDLDLHPRNPEDDIIELLVPSVLDAVLPFTTARATSSRNESSSEISTSPVHFPDRFLLQAQHRCLRSRSRSGAPTTPSAPAVFLASPTPSWLPPSSSNRRHLLPNQPTISASILAIPSEARCRPPPLLQQRHHSSPTSPTSYSIKCLTLMPLRCEFAMDATSSPAPQSPSVGALHHSQLLQQLLRTLPLHFSAPADDLSIISSLPLRRRTVHGASLVLATTQRAVPGMPFPRRALLSTAYQQIENDNVDCLFYQPRQSRIEIYCLDLDQNLQTASSTRRVRPGWPHALHLPIVFSERISNVESPSARSRQFSFLSDHQAPARRVPVQGDPCAISLTGLNDSGDEWVKGI